PSWPIRKPRVTSRPTTSTTPANRTRSCPTNSSPNTSPTRNAPSRRPASLVLTHRTAWPTTTPTGPEYHSPPTTPTVSTATGTPTWQASTPPHTPSSSGVWKPVRYEAVDRRTEAPRDRPDLPHLLVRYGRRPNRRRPRRTVLRPRHRH